MLTGTQGDYRWLETEHDLGEFLLLCPEVMENRYPVVTSVDSGPFRPSPPERVRGWSEVGGIAYGPVVDSITALPPHCQYGNCCGYIEWYLFETQPPSLGTISLDNVFEAVIEPGVIFRFINFLGFAFSDAAMNTIADLFWKQMAWMRPESFLAVGAGCQLFASRNSILFDGVVQTLRNKVSVNAIPGNC